MNLDPAYGQMKLSKETSQQGVFALIGGKVSGYFRFKSRNFETEYSTPRKHRK